MTDNNPTTPATLSMLQSCRDHLSEAHADALCAADRLTGARAARAIELAEKIADCLCFTERLIFVCTADSRYEEQRDIDR